MARLVVDRKTNPEIAAELFLSQKTVETHLRNIFNKLGVADRVEIRAVPAADRAELSRRLGGVALVVLLSEHETQPVAALEAVAVGRPVLVLDTTGLSELAERGLARAIRRESTAADVAAAVVRELDDPFVPKTVDLPTWDECAARHRELYLEVVARRSRPGSDVTSP